MEILNSPCSRYRVVFGMPEDEYHKDPALGSSGVRMMLVHPFTFWANSHMNPDKEESDSDAKDFGKAYHMMVLEGPDAFHARYSQELDPSDHPNHLKSGDQLKKRCGELGLSKGGSLQDMSLRIREVDKETPLWTELEGEHRLKNEGKLLLSKKDYRRIELAHRALMASGESELVSGGESEVSIFWPDPETGVECKARLDYLRPNRITDLKTFSNERLLPLMKAVGNSITNYRYLIQTLMYREGLSLVMQHISDPRLGDPKFHVNYTMLFQETGRAPNVVAKDIKASGNLVYWTKAEMDYRSALALYAHCVLKYEYGEPWVEAPPRSDLEDDELPNYHFTTV